MEPVLTPQPVQGLSTSYVIQPDSLWTTIGVLIALCGVALLVCNLIKTVKELRGPKLHKEKSVNDKLANDNERISELETAMVSTRKEMTLLLRSQMVMMHHMIDGNNIDRLKVVQGQIEDYLTLGKMPQEIDRS